MLVCTRRMLETIVLSHLRLAGVFVRAVHLGVFDRAPNCTLVGTGFKMVALLLVTCFEQGGAPLFVGNSDNRVMYDPAKLAGLNTDYVATKATPQHKGKLME